MRTNPICKRIECAFCRILQGKSQQRIIAQKKHAFVIFSDPRLMPGHLLVIPKRHVVKFSELTKAERHELFDTAVELQEKILKNLSSGCDLRSHFRPFIKDSWVKVSHLHIHLQPRENKDNLWEKSQKRELNVFKKASEKEIAAMRRKLKL